MLDLKGFCVGSPPHGRGKGLASHVPALVSRITPAWAGKSHCAAERLSFLKDHPRVGGEKWCNVCNAYQRKGSPPRGRGKVALAHVASLALGITPAWAGKSDFFIACFHVPKDHPRVGGEKTKKIP